MSNSTTTKVYALTDRNDKDRTDPIIDVFTTRAAAEAHQTDCGYGEIEEFDSEADACGYLYTQLEPSASDVIEDQLCFRDVPESKREAMAIEILGLVAEQAPDSIAHWLTLDETSFPISDDVDTYDFEGAQMIWRDFIETGYSGTSLFEVTYSPVTVVNYALD